MSKDRSSRAPFKSLRGDEYLDAAQYLAELACIRIARHERVELPDRYWLREGWSRELRLQVTHATRLLGRFDVAAILEALRTPKNQRVLVPLCEEQQKRLDWTASQPRSAEAAPPAVVVESPRPAFVTKTSIIAKLKTCE
jgi:hypothetical protein